MRSNTLKKSSEEEVRSALDQIKNIPVADIGKETNLDPPGAKKAFEKMKEIGGDPQDRISEIIKLQEDTKDSFFHLYANLVLQILDAKEEEVNLEKKEGFLKVLNSSFSFLENETSRDKDDDMKKAIEVIVEFGKSDNPAITNILTNSFAKTFSEAVKIVDEVQKEESKNSSDSPESESAEIKEKSKKNKDEDDKELQDKLVKGGLAATMLTMVLVVPPPPLGGALISLGLYCGYKKFYAKDEKDEKLKGDEEEISPEIEKYKNTYEQFLKPQNIKETPKTSSEEVSEKLAEEATEELESVKKSLKEKQVELQEQNKEAHQDLLAQFEKPVEESELEVKEKNVEQKNAEEESPDLLRTTDAEIKSALDDEEIKETLRGGSFENFDDTGQFSHNLGSKTEEKNKKTSYEI